MTAPDSAVTSKQPLVVLHGDEMAQVAFQEVLQRFVRNRTAVTLAEHDLSAKNRLKTQGEAVKIAMEDVKRHKAGVKNAGVTVTAAQKAALLAELAAEGCALDADALPPLAFKSPNGAIRKAIDGNIVREDIPFSGLARRRPEWQGRDVEMFMPSEGGAYAPAFKAPSDGTAEVHLTAASGESLLLHSRKVNAGDPVQLARVPRETLQAEARAVFKRGLETGKNVFIGLKDTVVPGYDGVMKTIISEIFDAEFKEAYARAGLSVRHSLIDAQAASVLISPPESCLWFTPDQGTALYMRAAVERLKREGFAAGDNSCAVARMSAGGADQYGSFQCAAPADGALVLTLCGQEAARFPVTKGSPLILMHNEKASIRAWAQSVLEDAARADEEAIFGLDAAQPYDRIFIEYVEEAIRSASPKPACRIVPAAELAEIMLCNPPAKARYACKNLDGDVLSDVAAAKGGSLATASSAIVGSEGIKLFEAPHGTAPDLYQRYLDSGRKEAFFNPAALIWALAEGLSVRAQLDQCAPTAAYADQLKQALIRTVDGGTVTPDLKGALKPGTEPHYVDLPGFLDATERELDQLQASHGRRVTVSKAAGA